jgi:hypothetical protein
VPPSTDGTASIANREIGRVLPANYRKVPFSGAVERLNEAATARYFGQLSGESPETGTAWRSAVVSNSQATSRTRYLDPTHAKLSSVRGLAVPGESSNVW